MSAADHRATDCSATDCSIAPPPGIGRLERGLAAGYLAVVGVAAAFATGRGLAAAEVRLLPCPVHWATGLTCPGCGITRASVALVGGDPVTAWALHPGAFLLVPLAVAVLLVPSRLPAAWARLPTAARIGLPTAAVALAIWRWLAGLAA